MENEKPKLTTRKTYKTKTRRDRTEVVHKQVEKQRKCKEYGVTRKEFHSLLQKASQPVGEAKSEQGKSET